MTKTSPAISLSALDATGLRLLALGEILRQQFEPGHKQTAEYVIERGEDKH